MMMSNIKLAQPIEIPSEDFEPGTPGSNKLNFNEMYPVQAENLKPGDVYSSIETDGNKWMEHSCNMALQSVKSGGGPFGAVMVQVDDRTHKIIRYWEASNRVTEQNDPTAHAEVMAIRSACASLGVYNLGEINKDASNLPQPGKTSHCEIYSSCEPCPMCYSAILWARIPRLYFAATRYDAAVPGVEFSDEEIYEELKVPYSERNIQVQQCHVPNSLDAFNLWKNSEKQAY